MLIEAVRWIYPLRTTKMLLIGKAQKTILEIFTFILDKASLCQARQKYWTKAYQWNAVVKWKYWCVGYTEFAYSANTKVFSERCHNLEQLVVSTYSNSLEMKVLLKSVETVVITFKNDLVETLWLWQHCTVVTFKVAYNVFSMSSKLTFWIFMESCLYEDNRCKTGLSDFHKMKRTVLKKFCTKQKHNAVFYRNYRTFDSGKYSKKLKKELMKFDINNVEFQAFHNIQLSVPN